jgi:hypothetical protein
VVEVADTVITGQLLGTVKSRPRYDTCWSPLSGPGAAMATPEPAANATATAPATTAALVFRARRNSNINFMSACSP